MNKKIVLGLLAAVIVTGGVAAMSAWEAHVINVTATIENGLTVTPDEIAFGTVFPQEEIDRNIDIALSTSFLEEDRVDDICYRIEQKPKVKVWDGNPEGDPWKVVTIGSFNDFAWKYCLKNLPVNSPIVYNPTDEYYTYCYVPLANYLSKHKDPAEVSETSDIEIDAPHYAYTWCGDESSLNSAAIASGTLSKKAGDIIDRWVIDLKVPCFEGMCDEDPLMGPQWWVDRDAESEVFGTDLWIEVYDVSVNYIDRVDIGNPDSEIGHLVMIDDDWSYIGSQSCTSYPDPGCLRLGNYGGYDGGKADFRGLMGAPTGCGDGHWHATFTMDIGMSGDTKELVLRHLDGSQSDGFDVFVTKDGDRTNIGHYYNQTSTEDWYTTTYEIPARYTSIVEIELVATDPVESWCGAGWGQVMFNWAEVR